MMDYTGDWQGRSRRLYQAAAEVAGRVGIDTDRTEIGSQSLQSVRYGSVETLGESAGVPLAALGQTRVSLRLRNWTAQPRKWQAATTQPWIRPLKSSGDLAGQEDLPILLDGAALKAGQKVAGELTITDLAAGRSTPVWITAGVLKAVDFIARNRVFNVTVGSSESRDFLLVNRTTGGQTWQISSSAPWLTVEPARGQLDAGESTFVKVTARPTDPDGARHETALVLLAAGGAVNEQWPFRTFVIPPYRRPERLPAGQPVPLESVSSQLLLRHRSIGWFTNRPVHDAPTFGAALDVWHSKKPLIIGQETYPAGLWIIPAHETVYRLTGSGFVAFSAEVGWNAMVAKSDYGAGHHNLRMNFQVHADGKVVAQSGPMKATDPARLLVAENLAAVKELKLVSRTDFDEDDKLGIAYCNWAVPTFYRAK
jgi:hypothetical protein